MLQDDTSIITPVDAVPGSDVVAADGVLKDDTAVVTTDVYFLDVMLCP